MFFFGGVRGNPASYSVTHTPRGQRPGGAHPLDAGGTFPTASGPAGNGRQSWRLPPDTSFPGVRPSRLAPELSSPRRKGGLSLWGAPGDARNGPRSLLTTSRAGASPRGWDNPLLFLPVKTRRWARLLLSSWADCPGWTGGRGSGPFHYLETRKQGRGRTGGLPTSRKKPKPPGSWRHGGDTTFPRLPERVAGGRRSAQRARGGL